MSAPDFDPNGRLEPTPPSPPSAAEFARAAAALQATPELLHEIASTLPEAVWVWDVKSDSPTYVSPSYARLWQRPDGPFTLTREEWLATVHPVDRERVRAAMTAALQTGRLDESYRITTPSGDVRWIHDRGAGARDARGDLVRLIGIAADVTERRHLEEQLRQAQKMESMGQLASGVAHDFNNWLTVIIGYVELLGSAVPGGSAAAHYVAEIRRASERAAGLTRQLLAFSRKEALDPRVLHFNHLIADTQRMLRRLVGDDVLIEAVLGADVGCVRVDPTQWVQVLTNLAVNARDAMPTGGRLTIATSRADVEASPTKRPDVAAGPYVCLLVADNGCGMTGTVRSRAFDPFYTTKPAGKGTGLGLTMVHRVIEAAGGFIEVDSEPGRGTTFRLFIPEVNEAVQTPLRASSDHSGSGECVLVVDDEPSLREVASFVLRGHGYRVVQARDGADAMRLLKDQGADVDVLFTDVVMPHTSGRELVETARQEWPHIRVIYTTGYTDDAMVRYGIEHREVAFLRKPYTPKELLAAIRAALDAQGPV